VQRLREREIPGLRNRDRERDERRSLLQPLGVERVGAFGQKSNFIYYHRKGIGIPLRKGITIPLNNIQRNKGIVIP